MAGIRRVPPEVRCDEIGWFAVMNDNGTRDPRAYRLRLGVLDKVHTGHVHAVAYYELCEDDLVKMKGFIDRALNEIGVLHIKEEAIMAEVDYRESEGF